DSSRAARSRPGPGTAQPRSTSRPCQHMTEPRRMESPVERGTAAARIDWANMTDTSAPAGTPAATRPGGAPPPPRYDRSIVEGPLAPAVWRLAWPTMLVNIIGGLQSMVDQVLVGHIVGFAGNAAIGVANQIFIAVVIFVSSLFTGMSVMVSRFVGAGDADEVN